MTLALLMISALLGQTPPSSTPPVAQPASQTSPSATTEVPVLDAKLGGDCSADFTVRDASGAPVYNALVHVRVRYGPAAVKRMDLEIGTDSQGKARIVGLPPRARPLVYDITKGTLKGTAGQDLRQTCRGEFTVTLK